MPASHTRNGSKTAEGSSGESLVLYGLDERGKPRAACFAAKDESLARKAASLMGLKVLPVARAEQTEIAARLPVGRIYSSGRGLVPNIRAALYGKLLEASAGDVPNGKNGTAGPQDPPGGAAGQCPPRWNNIAVGQLVIAKEDQKEWGWSEATVVHKNGDIFALRWKDPPNKRLIQRHRLNLALPYSDGQSDNDNKSGSTAANEAPRTEAPHKPAVANQAVAAHKQPSDWSEIDVGSVVLAWDDGPDQEWWEGVVTAKAGESFTLLWRDHEKLPQIVRQRLKLALICPISLALAKTG